MPLTLPSLPSWAQQFGGILPLSALIELIDVETKVHLYELSGCVPLWNWPVTPVGARLLLSNKDNAEACRLDQAGQSPVLECFDGRHGDHYPCSAAATTRLWASTMKVKADVPNTHPNIREKGSRRQTLDIFHVSHTDPAIADLAHEPASLVSRLIQMARKKLAYRIVGVTGWVCWIGMFAVALLSKMYIVMAYLLMMSLTGFAVSLTHGNKPRQLLPRVVAPEDRLVIAANNPNASTWWAFYGKNYPVNSILNTPLYRKDDLQFRLISRWVLRLLILGQWAAALASCSLQSWDALLISMWIVFCASTTSYLSNADYCARDWLHYDCHIRVKHVQTQLSSRRALLSALVYLNPDSKNRCTGWMDSILSSTSSDRREWELALLGYVEGGSQCVEETAMDAYWWRFIIEGVEVGRKLKEELKKAHKCDEG